MCYSVIWSVSLSNRSKCVASLLLCVIVSFILSCKDETITANPTTNGIPITIPKTPGHTYFFARDSLFKEWLPLYDGSIPFSSGVSIGKPIYNMRSIPGTCWVWRINHELKTNEDCKLIAETLYCPFDTNFIDWQICCPETLGINQSAKRSSSSSF